MSDSTLELVRKLLAKAERTTVEAERDAYNAKAADLIAKYGIDAALLAAASDAPPEKPGDRVVVIPAPYIMDKATLLNTIARACRVEAVLRSRSKTSASAEVHLFGFAADLERVELLFTSLLVQASFGLANARPTDPFEDVAAYRRSWLAGFTGTIGNRLTDAERRAQAEATPGAPGVALVLVGRDAAVRAAVSLVYPRLRSSSRRLSGSGYGAGQAAGQRADLGGTRVGGARRSSALAC